MKYQLDLRCFFDVADKTKALEISRWLNSAFVDLLDEIDVEHLKISVGSIDSHKYLVVFENREEVLQAD